MPKKTQGRGMHHWLFPMQLAGRFLGAGSGAAAASTTTPKYRSYVGKWDECKLWQLGYKQELQRKLTTFNNMSVCFSVLSYFAIIDTYSTQGLMYGGPVSVIWGWIACSAFSVVVAVCLAELLSAYPVAGNIYYCSFALAPSSWRTLICWMAGWLNLLGQVAFTAGLEFSLARSISTLVYLHTGGREGGGVQLSDNALLGLVAALLVIHAALNSVSTPWTAYLASLSFFWHVVATAAFCATLLWAAQRRNDATFVFTAWQPNTQEHGIHSPLYIFLLGLLMSQWAISGYDASANMAEETINSEYTSCYAMVGGVLAACCMGLLYLIALTFVLQDEVALRDPDNATGGRTATIQLVWDVFAARYGNGKGAIGLSYIPVVGLFLCINTSVSSNARTLYAFSRDGAVPAFRLWRQLWGPHRQPIPAAWAMCALALLVAAPAVYQEHIFTAISAGSVVALSVSYAIPIFLRLFHDRFTFLTGPLNLGRAARPLGAVACAWLLLVSVVFLLPTEHPVTAHNSNYTIVLVTAVVALALALFYAPKVGGRHWFTGPAPNLE